MSAVEMPAYRNHKQVTKVIHRLCCEQFHEGAILSVFMNVRTHTSTLTSSARAHLIVTDICFE